jgi:lipopolysaccharide/colanic/teichoic acid biosynthesis glycosyltransferase
MPTVRSDDYAGHEAVEPPPPPPSSPRSAARLMKHALDRVLALCGLLVTTPLIAITALAIRRHGPILRRDRRLGEGGRTIVVLSFAITDEMCRSRAWRLAVAAGLTALPQLWNVVRGDISLVGPRPRSVDAAAPPCRPGLTGLAQLEQLSRPVTVCEQLELDDEYARTWSLGLDARIVLRTFWRVLR